MNPTQLIPLEPGNRIQLPAEWTQAMGLHGLVSVERTAAGILIRPGQQYTWDEIFATRLTVRPSAVGVEPEVTEVGGDDLLF